MNFGRALLHMCVLSTGILAAARGPLQSSEKPLRYARVAVDGAKVRNLADDKGKEVGAPARGTLVAVFTEKPGGWLEVEVPGGFPVWMFGRYLKATGEEGIYEVTGDAVNLRPEPTGDVTSFPLPQRLQSGDKVRGIELLEPHKPLAETWARIWSPPGVHGLLRASAVEPLPAGEDGAALWGAALQALPDAPPPRKDTVRASEPTDDERRESDARRALEQARSDLQRERAKETPDYAPVRSALNAVLVQAPSGAVAIEARAELRSLEGLEESAALKAELERERSLRQEEALKRQQEVWDKSRAKDPLGSVFASRGILERRTGTDRMSRYFLRFGGDTRSEVLCTSGRYDLGTFAGYEIGVQGSEVPARTSGVPAIEVSRIEVLTVR